MPLRWVSWNPLAPQEVVLSCDGSRYTELDSSGYGGCLRDARDTFIFWYMGFGRSASVLHMELMTIYCGLLETWEKGFRRVVCYSYSQLAFSLVHHPPLVFHEFVVLVGHIRDLIQRVWKVCLLHTLRE